MSDYASAGALGFEIIGNDAQLQATLQRLAAKKLRIQVQLDGGEQISALTAVLKSQEATAQRTAQATRVAAAEQKAAAQSQINDLRVQAELSRLTATQAETSARQQVAAGKMVFQQTELNHQATMQAYAVQGAAAKTNNAVILQGLQQQTAAQRLATQQSLDGFKLQTAAQRTAAEAVLQTTRQTALAQKAAIEQQIGGAKLAAATQKAAAEAAIQAVRQQAAVQEAAAKQQMNSAKLLGQQNKNAADLTSAAWKLASSQATLAADLTLKGQKFGHQQRMNDIAQERAARTALYTAEMEALRLQNAQQRANNAQQQNWLANALRVSRGGGMAGGMNNAAMAASFVSPELGMAAMAASMGKLGVAALGLGVTIKTLNDATDKAATFQKELQQIAALTGMAGQEMNEYGKFVQDLSLKLPLTTSQLNEMSRQAVMVGMHGKEGIELYTKNMAALSIVLRQTGHSQGEVELTGQELIKILRSTGLEGEKLNNEFSAMVNGMVALKTQSGVLIPEVTQLMKFWSSQGAHVGLTVAQMTALSAALIQTGARAQGAGGALSIFFDKASKAMAQGGEATIGWAKTIGLSTEETKKLLKENPMEFLRRYVDGANKAEHQGKAFAITLSEVGLNSQQVRRTMAELSQALPLLDKNVQVMNAGMSDSDKAMRTAQEAADNYKDKVQMLHNAWDRVLQNLGGPVSEMLANWLEKVTPLSKEIGDLSEKLNTVKGQQEVAVSMKIDWGTDGTFEILKKLFLGGAIAGTELIDNAFKGLSNWDLHRQLMGAGVMTKAATPGGELYDIQRIGADRAYWEKRLTDALKERAAAEKAVTATAVAGDITGKNRLFEAFAAVESRGAGDYKAFNTDIRKNGQGAVGRYQIMPFNLIDPVSYRMTPAQRAAWAQNNMDTRGPAKFGWDFIATGKDYTIREILNSPELQNKIMAVQMQQRMKQALKDNNNDLEASIKAVAKQWIGTGQTDGNLSPQQYAQRVWEAYKKQGAYSPTATTYSDVPVGPLLPGQSRIAPTSQTAANVIAAAGLTGAPITQEFGATEFAKRAQKAGMKGYEDGTHHGVDFGVPIGTKLYSPSDAKVVIAGWNKQGYGNLVKMVDEQGNQILMAHLSQISEEAKQALKSGGTLKRGTLVGLSGNTGQSGGPHLHLELRDKNGNPFNPLAYQAPEGSTTPAEKPVDPAAELKKQVAQAHILINQMRKAVAARNEEWQIKAGQALAEFQKANPGVIGINSPDLQRELVAARKGKTVDQDKKDLQKMKEAQNQMAAELKRNEQAATAKAAQAAVAQMEQHRDEMLARYKNSAADRLKVENEFGPKILAAKKRTLALEEQEELTANAKKYQNLRTRAYDQAGLKGKDRKLSNLRADIRSGVDEAAEKREADTIRQKFDTEGKTLDSAFKERVNTATAAVQAKNKQMAEQLAATQRQVNEQLASLNKQQRDDAITSTNDALKGMEAARQKRIKDAGEDAGKVLAIEKETAEQIRIQRVKVAYMQWQSDIATNKEKYQSAIDAIPKGATQADRDRITKAAKAAKDRADTAAASTYGRAVQEAFDGAGESIADAQSKLDKFNAEQKKHVADLQKSYRELNDRVNGQVGEGKFDDAARQQALQSFNDLTRQAEEYGLAQDKVVAATRKATWEIIQNGQANSDAYTQSLDHIQQIKDAMEREGAAADDATYTTDKLKGMLDELIQVQDVDPTQSGFTQMLDDLIQKGGEAGKAAQQIKDNLGFLLSQRGSNSEIAQKARLDTQEQDLQHLTTELENRRTLREISDSEYRDQKEQLDLQATEIAFQRETLGQESWTAAYIAAAAKREDAVSRIHAEAQAGREADDIENARKSQEAITNEEIAGLEQRKTLRQINERDYIVERAALLRRQANEARDNAFTAAGTDQGKIDNAWETWRTTTNQINRDETVGTTNYDQQSGRSLADINAKSELDTLEYWRKQGMISERRYIDEKQRLQTADAVRTLERARADHADMVVAQAQYEAEITRITRDAQDARQAMTEKAMWEGKALQRQKASDDLEYARSTGTISERDYQAQNEAAQMQTAKDEFEQATQHMSFDDPQYENLLTAYQNKQTKIMHDGVIARKGLMEEETAFALQQAQRKVDRSYGLQGRDELLGVLKRNVDEAKTALSGMIKGSKEYEAALKRVQEAEDRLREATSSPMTLGYWQKNIEELGKAYQTGEINADEFRAGLKQNAAGLEEMAKAAEKAGNPAYAEEFRKQAQALRAMTPEVAGVLHKLGKVAEYLEYTSQVAGAFAKLASAMGESEQQYDEMTGEKLQTPWQDLAANIEGVGNAATKLKTIVTDVMKIVANPADIGAWVSLTVNVISSIADAMAGHQKAKAELAKAQSDFKQQNPFLNSNDYQKAYIRSRGWFADTFGGGPQVVNEIDKIGLHFAQTMQDAFKSGISEGLKDAIQKNDFSLFKDKLHETVYAGLLQGTIDMFLNETLLKTILGPAIKAWSDAMKTPDTGDDAAAMAGIDSAINQVDSLAGQFYGQVAPKFQELQSRWNIGDSGQANSQSGTLFGNAPTLQLGIPHIEVILPADALKPLSDLAAELPRFSAAVDKLSGLDGTQSTGANASLQVAFAPDALKPLSDFGAVVPEFSLSVKELRAAVGEWRALMRSGSGNPPALSGNGGLTGL